MRRNSAPRHDFLRSRQGGTLKGKCSWGTQQNQEDDLEAIPTLLRALPGLRLALLPALIALVLAPPAWPQPQEPFGEEAAKELVRAALVQYFDPASVVEVSTSGAALSGAILAIEDLLIVGNPAVLHGFRGEMLAHATGLRLDMEALKTQRMKIVSSESTIVVARSTARAVEEGLTRLSANILKPSVRFHAGEFEVVATFRRGEQLYPIQARGTLAVEQQQRVNVSIVRMLVSGGGIPENVVEGELRKINPILDLSSWPFNLRIQRLTLHNDTVELLMTNGK